MNTEPKDTTDWDRDECANCCTMFGAPSLGGDCGKNLENYQRAQSRTKIMTFALKMNGKDETIQVVDALTEMYRLDWFRKIKGNPAEAEQNDLSLCLDCFVVFSQLYRLFSEFQLVRKAESALAERLGTINSAIDLLLVNSIGTDLGHSNLQSATLNDWQENTCGNVLRTESAKLPGINDVNINAIKDEQVDAAGPNPFIISALSLSDNNFKIEGCNISHSVSSSNQCSAEGLQNVPQNSRLNEEPVLHPTVSNNICRLVQEADDVSEEILGLGCDDPSAEESGVQEVDLNFETFECVDCDKTFITAGELGKHRTEVHRSSEVYKCHVCMKVVARKEYLRRHLSRHSSARPYNCKICSATFKEYPKVRRHLINVHNRKVQGNWEVVKMSSNTVGKCNNRATSPGFPHADRDSNVIQMTPITDPEFHQCQYCNETFLNQEGYNQHVLLAHSQPTIECRVCRQKFSDNIDHIQLCAKCGGREQCHLYPPDPMDSQIEADSTNLEGQCQQSYPCRKCGIEFPLSLLRRKHEHIECNYWHEKAHPCRLCTQTFSSNVNLAHHLTSDHVVDFRFQCTVCGSLFDTLEEWTGHAATHSDFQCLVCGSIFTNRRNLRQHQRRHTQQRIYRCGICQTDFKLHHHLQRHVQNVHRRKFGGDLDQMPDDGVDYSNPFVCKICKTSFACIKNLRLHSEIHSDPIRDEVDSNICNSSLPCTSNSKFHSLMHSRSHSRPLHCKHCGDKFKTTLSLKQHQKVHARSSLHPNPSQKLGGRSGDGTSLRPRQSSSESSGSISPVNESSNEEEPPTAEGIPLIFKCTDCEDEFHSAVRLGAHRSSAHEAVDPFKCHFCWESFAYPNELRLHLTGHVNGGARSDAETMSPASLLQVMLTENVEAKEEIEEPDAIPLD